jgi:hypothetical protein
VTRPVTPLVLGVFFALSTCILLAGCVAILWPGTPFDAIWRFNENKRALLMLYRGLSGPGFFVLAMLMAAASAGCFARAKWGWWLAVGIFAANGLGDLVQLAAGHLWEGGIGVTVAAAILYYLWRPKVRAMFT